MNCCLCGRPMEHAAVLIGELPVGPKCAQRAGLLELAGRKGGLVFHIPKSRGKQPVPRHETLDLFENLEEEANA